jgi:HEAT repeat protein
LVLADGGESKKHKPTPSSYTDYAVFSDEKYSQIEENYLAGLNSDNIGLRTSCAYFVGEMKSDKAIIPLLKLLRNGETEYSRIIAALSLYKIGSKIGIHRIKGLAQTDKSENVRRVLNRLYKTYVTKKSF